MRSAPPNPANYAQRSGRDGRSGQAALVFTYCPSNSPHDRHYFVFAKNLTDINNLFTICSKIRDFASKDTERFFMTGKARRLSASILKRAAMRLAQLDAATRIEDLRLPPSNQLEALAGDRVGQWSIRINRQWRVCFRFANGDAFAVEIVDYH